MTKDKGNDMIIKEVKILTNDFNDGFYEKDLVTEAKAKTPLYSIIRSATSVIKTLSGADSVNFNIYDVKSTPMLGTKSHVFSAQVGSKPVINTTGNQGYRTVISFHEVLPGETPDAGLHPCRVGCSCDAYYYFFGWWNFEKDCHYGRRPRPYKPVPGSRKRSVNPQHKIGCCKHIIGLARLLQDNGFIK